MGEYYYKRCVQRRNAVRVLEGMGDKKCSEMKEAAVGLGNRVGRIEKCLISLAADRRRCVRCVAGVPSGSGKAPFWRRVKGKRCGNSQASSKAND